MKRCDAVLAGLLIGALLTLATFVDAAVTRERRAAALEGGAALAARLGLTDLALFPEARYSRHPSLADRFSAFQDHPAALDHFPAGALFPPPAALRKAP